MGDSTLGSTLVEDQQVHLINNQRKYSVILGHKCGSQVLTEKVLNGFYFKCLFYSFESEDLNRSNSLETYFANITINVCISLFLLCVYVCVCE